MRPIAYRICVVVGVLVLGFGPAQAQLRGHGGPVRALAISADGKTAVSGSFDTSAIIWSLARNAAEQVLRGHDGAVNAVAFLKDGRIVTASADAKIAVWTPGRQQPDKVLVVEDEEPIRKLHRRMLKQLDLDVVIANSGAEARDAMLAGPIDIVISDVKMPGAMSGVDLFRWVVEERPALTERFLFVTGDTHDPVLLELWRAHPDRFITKPFQVSEYLGRIRELMRGCAAPDGPAPEGRP